MQSHPHSLFVFCLFVFPLSPVPFAPQAPTPNQHTGLFQAPDPALEGQAAVTGFRHVIRRRFHCGSALLQEAPGCAERWASAEGTNGLGGLIRAASSITSTHAPRLPTPSHRLSALCSAARWEEKVTMKKEHWIHVNDLPRVVWEPPSWT